MNVNLGPSFDQFVAELIKSGDYQSQSEVIRDGLRLLKEREELRQARLAQLRKGIDKGIGDLEAGDYKTVDEHLLEEVFESSKCRGRKTLTEQKSRAA